MQIIIFFLVIVVLWLIWKYWTLLVGAGYDPTPMHRVRKMLDLAEIHEDDLVYDLGCGDGRIVTAAARHYGAHAVGIEIDPFRYVFAVCRMLLSGVNNRVSIRFGSMYALDIRPATVVTLFLYQPTNNKLKRKLINELAPGTRVVTYMWTFDGWQYARCIPQDEIYLYIVGKQEQQHLSNRGSLTSLSADL